MWGREVARVGRGMRKETGGLGVLGVERGRMRFVRRNCRMGRDCHIHSPGQLFPLVSDFKKWRYGKRFQGKPWGKETHTSSYSCRI